MIYMNTPFDEKEVLQHTNVQKFNYQILKVMADLKARHIPNYRLYFGNRHFYEQCVV